jgi:hypothetical protein
MGARRGAMASCHSDRVDDETAHHLQEARLDPVTLEPLDGPAIS